VEGGKHAQAIATGEGKSDRCKVGVELVTDEGIDVKKVKMMGGPNRGGARPARGSCHVRPCKGESQNQGSDPVSVYEAPPVGYTASVLSIHTTYRMQKHAYTEDEEGGENMTLCCLYYQGLIAFVLKILGHSEEKGPNRQIIAFWPQFESGDPQNRATPVEALGPVHSEKEAISGSFISDRIPVGPTTGSFWSGGLFPRCFGASGKGNTSEKRFHEIDSALRNGDGAPRDDGRFEKCSAQNI
jgi:hypothetical protein